jgi:hypothetical protein
MLAKKTSKNQVTLPRAIVDRFPDVEYFDALIEDNHIVLTPVSIRPVTTDLSAVRDKMEKLGITPGVVTDAVAWARKKKKS